MEIDFDAASKAWMANKIRKGPALVYRCTQIQKNGAPCPLPAKSECIPERPHLCKRHGKSWIATSHHPLTLLHEENPIEAEKVHASAVPKKNHPVPDG